MRPAIAGKAEAGMAHIPIADWTCGCAGKTVRSFESTCHTWALLRWCFTKRHYIKCTYLYLYLRLWLCEYVVSIRTCTVEHFSVLRPEVSPRRLMPQWTCGASERPCTMWRLVSCRSDHTVDVRTKTSCALHCYRSWRVNFVVDS